MKLLYPDYMNILELKFLNLCTQETPILFNDIPLNEIKRVP